MSTPQELIRRLGLERLGFEGGFYRETYRRSGEADTATAIYYMLTTSSRSMMHRLVSDEMYHFYGGDPVSMLLIHADRTVERLVLGTDVLAGQHVQKLVPAGSWQGSRLVKGGVYALMGTTMTPGFTLEGFELGQRSQLVQAYPEALPELLDLTPEVLQTANFELVAATADLLAAELRDLEALLKGLAALEAEPWPPKAREGSLKDELEAMARGGQAPWWYIVRSFDRKLVGTASLPPAFKLAVGSNSVRVLAGALTEEERIEIEQGLSSHPDSLRRSELNR